MVVVTLCGHLARCYNGRVAPLGVRGLKRNGRSVYSHPFGGPAATPGLFAWAALFLSGALRAVASRYKRVIGDRLRSRTEKGWATEVDLAVHVLNRMLAPGRLNYVRIT